MNRRCETEFINFDSINNCLNSDLEDLNIYELIGSGSFGKVYGGTIKYNGTLINVCIKVIEQIFESRGSKLQNDIDKAIDNNNKETEYSYRMSGDGLGPKIYDAFYYLQSNKLTQIIVQELMDIDAYKFLNDSDIDDEQKEILVEQMISLLKRQIYDSKLYCVDIKPGNYMVSLKRSRSSPTGPGKGPIIKKLKVISDVKMIDFGADWCRETVHLVLPDAIKSDIFFLMNLILLYILLKSQICQGHLNQSVLNAFKLEDIWINKKNYMFYIDSVYNSRFLTFPFYFNHYASICKVDCYKTGTWDFKSQRGYDKLRDEDSSFCLFNTLGLKLLDTYIIAENSPVQVIKTCTDKTVSSKTTLYKICKLYGYMHNFAVACNVIDLLKIRGPPWGRPGNGPSEGPISPDGPGPSQDHQAPVPILSALYISNIYGQFSLTLEEFMSVYEIRDTQNFKNVVNGMITELEKSMFNVCMSLYRIFNIYLGLYPDLHVKKNKILDYVNIVIIKGCAGNFNGIHFTNSLILETIIHAFERNVNIKYHHKYADIKKCIKEIGPYLSQ